MPEYVALIEDGAAATMGRIADAPVSVNGLRPLSFNRPSVFIGRSEPVPHGFTPIHTFRADTLEDAWAYFRKIQNDGVPADPRVVGNASGQSTGDPKRVWRWRGDVHYIKARLADFGLPDHTARAVQASPQFRKITTLLGQHCKTYHESPREDGVARLPGWKAAEMRRSLAVAEENVTILALLLASSMDGMDEAYRAFGIEHQRGFRLTVGKPEPSPEPAPSPDAPQEPQKRQPSKAVPAGK